MARVVGPHHGVGAGVIEAIADRDAAAAQRRERVAGVDPPAVDRDHAEVREPRQIGAQQLAHRLERERPSGAQEPQDRRGARGLVTGIGAVGQGARQLGERADAEALLDGALGQAEGGEAVAERGEGGVDHRGLRAAARRRARRARSYS